MANANVPAPPGDTPAAWQTWLPRIYRAYAIAVGACLIAAFAESFANLISYFKHEQFPTWQAWFAPSMVDIFTIGGETLVLIATVNRWERRYKIAGWAATVAGLAVSVAGNVGKDGWHVPVERAASYAIAPLALAGLLALGLAIIKRAMRPPAPAYSALPEPLLAGLAAFPHALNGGGVPGVDAIKTTVRCGQPRAQLIRDYLSGAREDLARYETETAA
jgi:Protein of unknown function (DUF2637)